MDCVRDEACDVRLLGVSPGADRWDVDLHALYVGLTLLSESNPLR